MASAPGSAAPGMRKEGSSNQLFVKLEEQPEESAREIARSGDSFPNPTLVPRGMWRCASIALVAAVVGCIVSYGALSLGAPRLTLGQETAKVTTAKPQQKSSMVIGTPDLPDALPAAPTPKVRMMGHPAYHCSWQASEKCPAWTLLSSADVFEVATENILRVAHGILVHADRDMVRDTVTAGFKNLSTQLHTRSPDAMHTLTRMELSKAQKNAVLTLLRIRTIPEVQRLGYEVALAVRRSVSAKHAVVQSHIEEIMTSHMKEIEHVRDDTVPEKLANIWGRKHLWDMTLDAENVRMMKAISTGHLFGSMNASFYDHFLPKTPKHLPEGEKAYAIWGAVLEEGRALLGLIRFLEEQDTKLRVKVSVTSLAANVDLKDLGSELLSCELHEGSGMNNLMKALFCPLKYGTQGLEAVRASSIGKEKMNGSMIV